MKIKILLIFILSQLSFKVFAQNSYSIKGEVADTVLHTKMVNTAILVLNAKDSIMQKFTRSDEKGAFSIGNLNKGKYILLLTYPGYADYVERFALDSTKTTIDFGKLSLILKSRLLADVIVKASHVAIKIKGDTTEFNAKAYVIQPNDKVEDLLKQLPGIQVDKDGKITAQGQTVNKVLVDGEEFFGDDPTLVTKNIRADMVDKVQLYDKKSDQASFTGIDDGQKTKTINIKLKEDKKNGYFGKADIGYGTNDFYQSQLLFNLFRAKMKTSAYTTISNDGKTGLGWQDNQKLGASSSNYIQDDNGLITFNNGSDGLDSFTGDYYGKGIPKVANSGLHYDGKWNKDKESINANIKSSIINVDGLDSTKSQNNLPSGGVIKSTTGQTFHNYMFRNKADLTYNLNLDTTSDLKIMLDGTNKHSTTHTNYATISKLNDTLQTTNNRHIINQLDGRIFNASAFYTKRFKTKGRTFSWNISDTYNESQAKGNLKTNISYYGKSPFADSSEVVDQYKTNQLTGNLINSNITYTEPLSKTVSLILNYAIGFNNSSADTRSYNKATDGTYTLLDSTYSNFYKLKQSSNQVGAIFNYKKGKTIMNFGTKVSDVSFDQLNEYTGNEFKRQFINWLPQGSFKYQFSQRSNLSINYTGRTSQPTVDQIQPVYVNTDPLNIIIGNAALTPSFTNNFNMYFNSYKVLSDQYFSIGGTCSFTSNPIVNNTVTDSVGKSTTQYINLNKTPYNYSIYSNFNIKAAALRDIGTSISFVANGNKNYNLSNGEVNAITANSYSARLQFQKNAQKKYNFYASFGYVLNYGGSSLQRNINNNGHGFRGDGGFTIYMPWYLSITTDNEYQYTSATQTFNQAYSKLLVNAWLVKAFNKEETIKITLACNDIFNQNSGFSRSSNGNLITQDNYTTIRRYFMLTLVWDFNKMGGAAKK